MDSLPGTGRIVWLGLRTQKRGAITHAQSFVVSPEDGIDGDHYQARSRKRQITLVQSEHLEVIANFVGQSIIRPEQLRRNAVVSGINLLALAKRRFRVGTVELQGTGHCHPCSRMEETFGAGGYNAVRGHGGITARILSAGTIHLGDQVAVVNEVQAVPVS